MTLLIITRPSFGIVGFAEVFEFEAIIKSWH
jgi:hypothetical protein